MLLYHGTSESKLEDILINGIRPRKDTVHSNWGHTIESRKDHVYLSDAYAPYFASVAAIKDKSRWAIIEIDGDKLKKNNFYPDEDFIAQMLNKCNEDCKDIKLIDLTKMVRDNITLYKNEWQNSLKAMGNVCYRGIIPIKAINRIALFNRDSNRDMMLSAIDPTITILNYMICGNKYKLLTQWFMGEKISLDDWASANFIPFDVFAETRHITEKQVKQEIQDVLDNQKIEIIFPSKNIPRKKAA